MKNNNNLNNIEFIDRFTYQRNIPFDETDLNSKGSKFQIVKFKSGAHLKPHYHKKLTEIFFIRSGKGLLTLNKQEFECKPDDFYLCKPNDIHEFNNTGNEELIILIFKTNEEKGDIYWI